MSKARDLANAGTALTTVSATELGYLDGVTSAVQTQIDSKIGSASAINPTIVDAKGDIIAATAADTVARLAVGSNNAVLTADSSTATGLKWATPSSGGMTLLSTTTLSGTPVTISSISQDYIDLYGIIENVYSVSDTAEFTLRFNGDTGTNYRFAGAYTYGGNITSTDNTGSSIVIGRGTTSTSDLDKSGGFFRILDYKQTDGSVAITAGTSVQSSVGVRYSYTIQGAYNNSAAIDSITLTITSGFSGGTLKLYGVK